MKKGLFITLEGIDFSGKSTQARYLINFLKRNNIQHLFLREPGGTKLSERIRRILLSKGEIDICPKSELWLYQAARSQIVQEKIIPAVKDGKIVICDRFYDSTTAYQSYGRGLELKFIQRINLFAAEGIKPDLTLLFDLPEKKAFERKSKLNRAKDRLENEKLAFFRRVRKGYLELAENNKRRMKVINADGPKEKVRDEMLETVVSFLKRRKIRIRM
ncbi:MAG: dTMP kinase [candidate division Zixibacteria bacterium]|nr:dTMP kinase [candidate division Zixibacteria bacterium]